MNTSNTSSDFTKYLCWDIAEAERVLDVDALAVDPAVFRAVHVPVAFTRRDSLPSDAEGAYRAGEGYPYDEATFLRDLSDTRSNYQLVSVIGPSGAGKSHLIRWLYIRLTEMQTETASRVILVPRAGTNLQTVLRMILEEMEGSQFQEFRERLSRTGEPISAEIGRSRLLDNLAERIEHGDLDSLLQALSGQPSNQVSWVRQSAPAFLRDVVFRREWLRFGGPLTRMYDMALGTASEVDRVEERRGFTEEDLPLDIDPRNVGNAAQESQQFYRQLVGGNSSIKTILLAVLNQYLDDAIQALLNISSEDLGNLLREVRRTLAQEGKTLVLFIEDVARLQGIDRQLLDALLERPESGGGEPLCSLRAVVGCTTGYFETLPNTFRTRCTFVVDLAEQHSTIREEEIVQMSSRYLNAARLGRAMLAEWHDNPESEVPSACDTCTYRSTCHAVFGSTDDFGHYPFNAVALKKLYARTNTEGRLNPRFLLNDVLRRALITNADKIENGSFPDGIFHRDFGGLSSSWTATDVQRIDRHAGGGETAERYRALLDLWSTNRQLNAGVYETFGLKALDDAQQTESSSETGRTDSQPSTSHRPGSESVPVPDPERSIQYLIDSLDGWARGGSLGQDVTNELRGHIYDAVRARLDWDSERLLPSQFSGRSSGSFTRTSINFDGQMTRPRASEVSLEIPLDGSADRTKVALGIQGLLRYSIHGSWNFSDGINQFRFYAQLVEDLAASVIKTLRSNPTIPFKPASAAAELLALGTQLHGLPSSTNSTPEGRIDAWYQDWQTSDGTTEWQRLSKPFNEHKDRLITVLEAHSLCAKGGAASTKWFDAVQFGKILRRRNAVPNQPMPPEGSNTLPTRIRFIGELRNAFDNNLDAAIEAECSWWQEWSEHVERDMNEAPFSEFREAVNRTREDLDKRGVPYLNASLADELRSLSRGLPTNDVERARSLGRNISTADRSKVGPLLREIGYANTLRSTAKRTIDYLDLVDRLCKDAESYLEHQLEILEDGPSATTIQEEIDKELSTLESILLNREGQSI